MVVRLRLSASALLVLLLVASPGVAQDFPGTAELAQMLAADQAVRHNKTAEQFRDRAFLQTMMSEDAERRRRTGGLLEAGAVLTAKTIAPQRSSSSTAPLLRLTSLTARRSRPWPRGCRERLDRRSDA
jgi:hypothetical protein